MNEEVQVLNPAPGVWVRQEVDNIAWIDQGDSLVVVDALERPELGGEVLDLLDKTCPGKPVRQVLNTHVHYDHTALNGLFVERFGAEIINAKTREIPAAGLQVGEGERMMQMLPMPGCHTAEDCLILLPCAGILFVGDIFGWGLIPWDSPLDREKASHILDCYEQLIALEAKVVVPGHGPLATTRELHRWKEYFRWLIAEVQTLRGRGMSRRKIRGGAIAAPEDMEGWWRFLSWKHEDSVKKISHAVVRGVL